MGVQLNIKDAETVRLARALAGQTGKSVTETIRVALQQAMQGREAEVQARIADYDRIFTAISDRFTPEFKRTSSKDAMDELYDERGLPK